MEKLTERQIEIINASIKIIAEDGIQSLTIKNISNSIGFSEAALYRHYSSKKNILHGILDLFAELSGMPEFPDDNEITEIGKIEMFLMDRYDKFMADRNFAKVMFSEAIFVNDPELTEKIRMIMHRHKESIMVFLNEGKEKGLINNQLDSISIFRSIIGSMRLLVSQWCYNDYKFNLKEEGVNLWKNIKIMIKT